MHDTRSRPSAPTSFAAKLDLHDAIEIRRAHAAGVPAAALARTYGVARSSLHAVLRARAHVCTITLRLDDQAYLRLSREAKRSGRTLVEVVATFFPRGLHFESVT